MKKLLSIIISAAMLLTSFTAVHCEDSITVTLDGKELAFDVPPQMINDLTMVPMRAIFEALGAEVRWNGQTQTITAISLVSYPHKTTDTTIIMQVENNIMTKTIWDMPYHSRAEYSGEIPIKLDVAPMMVDGRTLVPIRAVSEAFDCEVDWDGETKTVVINSNPSAAQEPVIQPTVEPQASDIQIEYDDTEERKAHYMRNFTITNVTQTDNGYDIAYTLETFLEGRGTVGVTFNCYDKDGNVVDSFSGSFVGTDYTWSAHKANALISDKTVKIELVLN